MIEVYQSNVNTILNTYITYIVFCSRCAHKRVEQNHFNHTDEQPIKLTVVGQLNNEVL